ncbi:MAG: hypothetical protein K2X08_04365 [Chlamydiales bacterium]|nr:hypothetical protein [Chlamydiales bacterium]
MRFWFILLFSPVISCALELQPWFGDVYEFHFLGTYAYSFFDRVQNGIPQLTSTFHSNVASFGLDFSLSPEWSVDADLQFADTTQEPANFRSTALQGRYLWLDDIVGDAVSLATGINARFTNTASLHDISCMYHSNFDVELNFSLGKEFDAAETWRFRTWAFGAVGQGIYGSPWVRGIAAVECNFDDQHKFALYAEGMNGYGRHTHVLIDHFDGYAKIRQKSIDLAFRYGYRIGVWGTLRVEYARRLLAKSCPQVVNTFAFSYLLPFSF